MLFAKLYPCTTPIPGQLLVMWENSEEPEYADTPYLVITKTQGSGVRATMEHPFRIAQQRDADFEAFDEVGAARLYASQQHLLAEMNEATSQPTMDFAKIFPFEDAQLGKGQLLMEKYESTDLAEVDAPYQILLKTMSPYGRLLTKTYSFADEAQRDEQFAGLTPLAAEGHYREMQKTIHQAVEL